MSKETVEYSWGEVALGAFPPSLPKKCLILMHIFVDYNIILLYFKDFNVLLFNIMNYPQKSGSHGELQI